MNSRAMNYLVDGLAAAPAILERLLSDATPADLDRRPDPDRFTAREVVAHLADMEEAWLERARRIRDEDDPLLPGLDESRLAIDHDYAQSDPAAQLARYAGARDQLVALLRGAWPDQLARTGRHSESGAISLLDLAITVLGHDAVHARQVAAWMAER